MTTAAMLPDADARHAIAADLDSTLIVEAAAGTGKTTELITRIMSVLQTGRATIDQIVAVTFTEKAAGELKLRLREALERARVTADAEALPRLDAALASLEEAHVNTIHGFCAELLRERPVEAAVDPLFVVLTEADARRLYDTAFHGWLQQALADPPEGVRRALRRTAFGDQTEGPVDRLADAGRVLAEWRAFPASWSRPPFDRAAAIDRIVTGLHALADMSAGGSAHDNLHFDLDGVRRLSRQIRLEQSFGQEDLDGWEARLIDLSRERGFSRTRKGWGAKFGAHTRAAVVAARDALFATVLAFRRDADADLAALLQQDLREATTRYQALKTRRGALDFADLLVRTRDLLRDNREVRSFLQRRFKRVFIDEFQDTDPVQAEILLLLCADDDAAGDHAAIRVSPGKLFIVGDPKQAIYRFRGADVGTYWSVCRQLEATGARVLRLTTNFRSRPAIQRLVNAAFSVEMRADAATLQAGYVPLAEQREADAAQPGLIALPIPIPYGDSRYGKPRPTAKAIEKSLPGAVGAFVAWLVEESAWTVAERQLDGTERPVPIQSRHIAILFRRFTRYAAGPEDVTRPYVEALEARGVAHLLVGGKSFHGREEVETVRAALASIEWPDDELSVFATLKGSLFAIDDEALLEFRDRFGVFHPFRIPGALGGNSGTELALADAPTSHLLPVADALRLLQRLHRERNRRPVADTVTRLLKETRAHVGFVMRPGGEQALANVLHVAELARQYESGGGISFRGFIDALHAAAGDSEAAEAPIIEEGSDGVRLITVHKAKGLEFPVVILADPTCRMNHDEPGRYVDRERQLAAIRLRGWAPRDLIDHEAEEVARDRAEGIRLAYVAATRARDLLVVPTVGDGPWDGGWLAPLDRGVYPPIGARQERAAAPGCPRFRSKDSVLVRRDDDSADERTVAPGLHVFEGYHVVWWDPRVLALDARPPSGVRRQDLIVRDVDDAVVESRRAAYTSWAADRDRARASGATASVIPETARAYAEREQDAALDVAVVEVSRGVLSSVEALAGGPAFGALVHAILADVPLDASEPVVRETARPLARQLGVSDEEVEVAVRASMRALDHDLLKRACVAASRGRCRRETPVTLPQIDGTLLEGVVDLAFEEHGTWTVVDYKTDRLRDEAGDARHRRQVAAYAEAIRRATGQNAAGIVLHLGR